METIFVSVASYRDGECVDTLVDLYRAAARPENVFVGVVTFTDPGDTSSGERCEAPQLEPYARNIRRINLDHTLSRGLSMARHHAAKLYRDQKYVLQIDSHMTFAPGWDSELLRMVKSVPSKKPLITTYPASDDDTSSTDVPVTCRATWLRGEGEEGVLRFTAALEPAPQPGEFLPVPFAAGAFMFGPAAVLHEVPHDPGLAYLFHGEEELYSARLWTSGWDLYTPDMNVLFHNYARGGSHSASSSRYGNKYWADLMMRPEYGDARRESLRKVAQLMTGSYPGGGGRYGMGTARALADWWAYAGLGPTDTATGADGSKFCKSLRYGTAGVKLLSGEDEPQQEAEAEGAADGAGGLGSAQSGGAAAAHTRGHRPHDRRSTKRRSGGRSGGGGGGSDSERTLAKGRQAVAGAQAVYDQQRAAAGGDRGP
ncbi:hypothetical protein HXX76_007981 [Chlamydomonas incerta]|uniref:Uncharacterized protein n=1 Tax=Chlamydomonas incerta TaxID=51695 RepID=A0A835T9V0_CHLIN|nr:hypothetical protein HXX76_007981 [Chlamydomonas incerta]|eukprot:KAG2434256.1 hypothetical protein HXX76_007981 [Chlamydomonas incerta]